MRSTPELSKWRTVAAYLPGGRRLSDLIDTKIESGALVKISNANSYYVLMARCASARKDLSGITRGKDGTHGESNDAPTYRLIKPGAMRGRRGVGTPIH